MGTERPRVLPEKFGTPQTAREFLTLYQKELEKMLIGKVPPEFFIRTALIAMHTESKLLECNSLSLLGVLFQIAQIQLLPGGITGESWAIPYKTIAQLQVGYKGYVAKAQEHSARIRARLIYKGDKFSISDSLDGVKYELSIDPNSEHNPGDITHALAVIEHPDGYKDLEIMTRAELDRRRGSAQTQNVWSKWYDRMALKTPIKAIGNRSGLLSLRRAASADETFRHAMSAVELTRESGAAVEIPQNLIKGTQEAEDKAESETTATPEVPPPQRKSDAAKNAKPESD